MCLFDLFQTLKDVDVFLIKPTSLEDLEHPYTKKNRKTWDTYRYRDQLFWSMFGAWKQNNLGGEPQKLTDQPTPREPWLDTI